MRYKNVIQRPLGLLEPKLNANNMMADAGMMELYSDGGQLAHEIDMKIHQHRMDNPPPPAVQPRNYQQEYQQQILALPDGDPRKNQLIDALYENGGIK